MGLINCPDCGKSVSEEAPACPHCGRPTQTEHTHKNQRTGYEWIPVLFVIAAAIFITYQCAGVFGGRGGTSASSPALPPPTRVAQTASQWFQGGTLHQSTIAEWKSATEQNKLATAGDWLAGTDWKGHLNTPEDFDRLKVKAQILADAVDEAVSAEGSESLGITLIEIVAVITTLSNDLGP